MSIIMNDAPAAFDYPYAMRDPEYALDPHALHDSQTVHERSPGDLEMARAEHYRDGEDGEKDGAATEAENTPLREVHQKHTHIQEPPVRSLHLSLPPRSPSSAFALAGDAFSRSSAAPPSVSQRRFQSVIAHVRFSNARRGYDPYAIEKLNRPLTESEAIALNYMTENEERRLAAVARVHEEEVLRHRMLADANLKKEAASINRFVTIVREKQKRFHTRRVKEVERAELARIRRMKLDEDRMQRCQETLLEKEHRFGYHDPYTLFIARQRERRQRIAKQKTLRG